MAGRENESPNTSEITHKKTRHRKLNITKEDIGHPSEFRHVSHVGWEPNEGFDIKCDDPVLNNFFHKNEAAEKQINTDNLIDVQEPVRKSASAPSTPLLRRHIENTVLKTNKPQEPIKKKNKRKFQITKADIGKPLDFRHVSHVGWNSAGFDINCNDPQLSRFFQGPSSVEDPQRSTVEWVRPASAPASILMPETAISKNRKSFPRGFSKRDIGLPNDFKHVSHITWDSETGFIVDCDDPELSAFLKLASVRVKELKELKRLQMELGKQQI